MSAARWAAGRAPSLALQLAPRLVPSSLRKHKRGQADIIGGAAVAIIAIRMALGRRQWVRAIAATELIGLRIEQQAAAVLIKSAKGSGNPRYVDESERTVNTAGAKGGTMLRTRRHSDLRAA